MRKELEKRFLYLYTGESFAIIGFIFVSYLLDYVRPELQLYSLYFFWVSFFLLEFILLQGTIYWYVKLKRLKKENTSVTPIMVVKRLKFLKKINIILIILCPVLLVIDILKWYPAIPKDGLHISGLIYIFALLEYINYFHIQLSYDNFSDIKYLLKLKRLKQSCINKDFKRIMKDI